MWTVRGLISLSSLQVADTRFLVGETDSDEWIGVVSGLDIGALDPPDAQLQMLSEYLSGEACGPKEQHGAARISRLIIAGNSLSPVVAETQEVEKKGVSLNSSPYCLYD